MTTLTVAIRLLVSALLGGLIGYERETKNHPAGLRTHLLVSMGAALVMIISIGGFKQYSSNGDPARLAAQVVSGIGFIGAGTIFKQGSSVRGLTTAASLWISAGIGLSVGVGFYFAAVFAAILSISSLSFLNRLEKKIPAWKNNSNKVIYLYCNENHKMLGEIEDVLASYNLVINKFSIALADPHRKRDPSVKNNYTKVVRLVVPIKEEVNEKEVLEKILNVEGVVALYWKDIQMTSSEEDLDNDGHPLIVD